MRILRVGEILTVSQYSAVWDTFSNVSSHANANSRYRVSWVNPEFIDVNGVNTNELNYEFTLYSSDYLGINGEIGVFRCAHGFAENLFREDLRSFQVGDILRPLVDFETTRMPRGQSLVIHRGSFWEIVSFQTSIVNGENLYKLRAVGADIETMQSVESVHRNFELVETAIQNPPIGLELTPTLSSSGITLPTLERRTVEISSHNTWKVIQVYRQGNDERFKVRLENFSDTIDVSSIDMAILFGSDWRASNTKTLSTIEAPKQLEVGAEIKPIRNVSYRDTNDSTFNTNAREKWTIFSVSKDKKEIRLHCKGRNRTIHIGRDAFEQGFGVYDFNNIVRVAPKATKFKAISFKDYDESIGDYFETKDLSVAKTKLKRYGNGEIQALINDDWFVVYRYTASNGFQRCKMFNGLEEAGYLKFS